LEILSFDALPSTQKYLIEAVRSHRVKIPSAVIASSQSDGIGSRDNRWENGSGNFFASIAMHKNDLPTDLPAASASIYFGFLMKEILRGFEKNIWLKWPNDIYMDDQKVGGVITTKINNIFIAGIGVNLKKNQNNYSALNLDIDPLILLNMLIERLKKKPNWKQVFSQYKIEFESSKSYFTHADGKKLYMKDAVLHNDGSIEIDKKKVYSLR